ncbi:hypothetical protein SUDANB148_02970 [Streptomyces sp. SudanB148_2056]|uniref:hypothetical protein n=1 Tax=Streptomyces sp. SudanB148_2056 TaxID=3035280 RepID=UPI003F574E73
MSSTTPAPKRVATVLLLICLSIVVILAAVSTFPAALSAALSIGLPRYAAVCWALLPDVATLVGALGALIMSDRKGRRFAISTVVCFGLSSAMVNVSHAVAERMGTPPTALLVAYGIVATLALILATETASRVVVSLVPAVEAKPVPRVEKKATEKTSGEKTNLPKRRDDETLLAQAREVASDYARKGKRLTVSAVQKELRLSWARAQKVHAEVAV